jgi:hypothetical protein
VSPPPPAGVNKAVPASAAAAPQGAQPAKAPPASGAAANQRTAATTASSTSAGTVGSAPSKATGPKAERAPLDVRKPIPEQIDQYLVLSQADCVTLEQRAMSIDALRRAVASVKEAGGAAVSGVGSKLEPHAKKNQRAEQKMHGLFDQLQGIKDRIASQGDDKSSQADLGKLIKQTQALFAKIDTASREAAQIGDESATACANAAATLSKLQQTPDRRGNTRIKDVAKVLQICTECENQIARYPSEATIEACQVGVKWLVTFLNNAASQGAAPTAPNTGAGSWSSTPRPR